MTDAAAPANGSSGAGSGAAATCPEWPGAARPAGRFLPILGEAAPPGETGTEPARTEAKKADTKPGSDDRPDDGPRPGAAAVTEGACVRTEQAAERFRGWNDSVREASRGR